MGSGWGAGGSVSRTGTSRGTVGCKVEVNCGILEEAKYFLFSKVWESHNSALLGRLDLSDTTTEQKTIVKQRCVSACE